jgi:predicted TIM-barrel fold metal-dependent hydrolase
VILVIDAHTHIGEPVRTEELGQAPRISPDTLVASMDRAGIDRSITFTDKGLFFYDKSENDKVAQAMRDHPRRLIGFACVNPRYGLDAVEELRRGILELGLKGLKLHPWVQTFSCTDNMLNPLFEEITKLEIPVLIHTGYDIFSGPLSVADLARRYPKVPIIMGHSGCCGLWYDAIKAAKRRENLYLETSGNLSVAIEKMVDNVGSDRVLFGSDMPWVNSAMEVLKVRKLNLTDQDKDLILGGNIERLMKEWKIG